MSKPEKHIDNIYRDRLINAEVSPPPKAWGQIASTLDNQAKSRRLIFYRRIVAAAALIIILLSVGIGFLFKQQNHQPHKITILPIDSTQVVVDSSIFIRQQPIQENLAEEQTQHKTLNPKKEKTFVIELIAQERVSIESSEREKLFKMTAVKSLSPTEIQYAFDWPELLKRTNFKKQLPFMLDDLLLNNDLVAETNEPKRGRKRWSLGGEFSPSYQNLEQGSGDMFYAASNDYINDLASPNTVDESMTAYSTGVAVNYAISDKLSVQSGLYYFKQGQEIQNFSVLSNRAEMSNSVTTASNSGIIEITSTEAIAENSPVYEVDIDMNNRVSQFDDALVQHFGFLEIPFLLKYKIVSTKLDVYILGGFNANILVRNDVFIGPDSKQSVGHTNNINSLVYKSAFGISLEYPINKHFYFNLSPMFKYQLTPINKESSNNYKTRLIEYKTGISYRF